MINDSKGSRGFLTALGCIELGIVYSDEGCRTRLKEHLYIFDFISSMMPCLNCDTICCFSVSEGYLP